MTRYYFSAEGRFTNDTTVLVWSSKAARDDHVKCRSREPGYYCIPISRRIATKEATNIDLPQKRFIRPRTFLGEFWGIVGHDFLSSSPGLVGRLEVCTDFYPIPGVQRLNARRPKCQP